MSEESIVEAFRRVVAAHEDWPDDQAISISMAAARTLVSALTVDVEAPAGMPAGITSPETPLGALRGARRG